ncbi:MAG: glycoside hydrolase family 88 protein [Alistipes sp.]|nr:glycoside hydrolase family 88 protein [Alistipes sp.]
MKKILLFSALMVAVMLSGCSERYELKKDLKQALKVAVEQNKQQAARMDGFEGKLPRTFEKGEVKFTDASGWVCGFFPGSLWLLYEHTGDEELKTLAEKYTRRVESAKDDKGTHDLGFMVFCSYGNAYRLTGDEYYKGVIEQAAKSLVTRYNPTVGCIRSWNTHRKENPELDFMVIIDNMMNLEMLEWVGGYDEITRSHAYTTIKNHFRDDYSTYHVVAYNEQTGEVVEKRTAQGFSDDSAWARGQAWGLYGYTMMYRMTGDETYLTQAVKIADYLIPRLPADAVPNWDYDAEHQQKDSSSASIMASALIELYGFTQNETYLATAERQLRSLSSEEYLAKVGENGNFLLKHGTGHLPGKSEIDVPLSYGDYYFIEAAMRYLAL